MLGKWELNKVHCEDSYKAIQELPSKSIDLILTDPPYEVDIHGGASNRISRTFANCINDISAISQGIDLKILEEFMRVMKRPNIYIWCNKKQVLDYLEFFVKRHECSFEILFWGKVDPVPLCGGNYLIDKEICLYFRKNVRFNTNFDRAFTYWITKKNIRDKVKFKHPTIKPIKIIKNFILNSSNENDIVFDPFAGSGTTGVACQDVGRQFIGFEIEKKWVKVANDRLQKVDSNGQTSIFTM